MRDQIAHARSVARVLWKLGWSVVVVGILGLAGVVVGYLAGELDLEQAFLAATGTVLGSILSGAGAYGSATNVSLGASRLELNLLDIAHESPGDQ